MSRIPPLSQDEADPAARRFFDDDRRAYGQVLNPTGLWARRPGIMAGVRGLGAAMAQPGLIPERLRRLINVHIAGRVGCGF